ncbi:hexokinase [Alternaria panax]|uniref:Phosphotransferase n=1 Tax=Alternaria panax TaxID=48097 RepID=A0AAD4F8A6_9PLEO|nr:hexokinase [Alternaria panax]
MSISSLSRSNKATRPLQSPIQSACPDRRGPTRSLFATHTVGTVLVLLLALGTGFFAPHLPHAVLRTITNKQAPSFTLRNPIVLQEPAICPKPEPQVEFVGTFNTQHKRSMTLADQAKRVAAEFDFDDNAVNKAVKEFIREMDEGLEKTGTEMSQIPTYVTAVPNGTEKGLYMAVDLGGTNFRVCSIELHGNTTFSLTQSKVAIPRELMVAKTSKELFSFLAKQIEAFLKLHHEDHYAGTLRRREGKEGEPQDEEIFNLGFTFSFPVQQIGINKGMLMRWTKGFDIQDAVGKDVCALLQQEIDELHLPVRVAALVNDTVGTLMARSYTSPGKTGTLLGAIFGTGTNGAYVEKLEKVTKLTKDKNGGDYDKSTGEMIVNTEWGSFDNSLRTLPNSPYDVQLDKDSVNPGIQMFEKRVSGMFLGELLRLALLKLIKDPAVPLFTDDNSSSNDVHSTTQIHDSSPIWKQWGLDTSFLSVCAGDNSPGFRMLRQTLDKDYDISAVSAEDAEAVREIAGAIGRRAARLAAVAIAGTIINTGRLNKSSGSATTEQKSGIEPARGDVDATEGDEIDIGVDGSLVEFYPNFEEYIREALRAIPEVGAKGEKRVRIGIAKDGSGVGAALIALVAGKVTAPQ